MPWPRFVVGIGIGPMCTLWAYWFGRYRYRSYDIFRLSLMICDGIQQSAFLRGSAVLLILDSGIPGVAGIPRSQERLHSG